MNKPLRLYYWHGKTPELAKKTSELWPGASVPEGDNRVLLPDMSLDEFYRKWNDKFMAIPVDDGIIVAVTHYNSFGQR